MRYPGNIVTAEDTRSKGYGVPTKCYYCNGVPGGQHDAECVCLDRPVKVLVTFELIVAVPRRWTNSDMEFYWNEGSYCMDNILDQIDRHKPADGCLCNRGEIRYAGEATIQEAIAVGLKPDTEGD